MVGRTSIVISKSIFSGLTLNPIQTLDKISAGTNIVLLGQTYSPSSVILIEVISLTLSSET